MIRLGVIGYGFRARHMVSVLKQVADVNIVAVCDVQIEKAHLWASQAGEDIAKIAFYQHFKKLLDEQKLDGVIVGTNCSSHTPIAIEVLKRDIPMFLEKPVSIDMAQLTALSQAARGKNNIVVSFPLRFTPLLSKVKELINNGEIGAVSHVQAWNNVPYGHVYFQSWYRDKKETGGLFLQKATHDFDYLNYLIGADPVLISAMASKTIYREHAGAKNTIYCKDCSSTLTCKESPYNPAYITSEGEWMKPEQYMCAFSVDAANEDCGSVLIQYKTGIHVAYSQNFFTKLKAAARGARLMGYDGTLEFDWYQNKIRIMKHHTPDVVEFLGSEIISQSHGGGDFFLARNFVDLIRGTSSSTSTIRDGLMSALMCICAKESAISATYKEISYNNENL